MRTRWQARVVWVALALAGVGGAVSCSHKVDVGTEPTASGKSLPPLSINDTTPDLILTWIDEKGGTHVEIHPPDVPAAGRSMVRVVVSDREDGTRDMFYVADLTKPGSDGGYATQTMSRHDWEAEIDRRRAAQLPKPAPPPAPPPAPSGEPLAQLGPTIGGAPAQQSGGPTVIIYGASWCGPCHQALNYLKSKGVSVVLKDIEEDPGANAEMRQKLQKAGRGGGGSIPVIDVHGQILVGFSAQALDRALAQAKVQGGMTL